MLFSEHTLKNKPFGWEAIYLQNHKNKSTSPPLTVLLQEILCQLQDTLLWMMPFSCRSKLDRIANLLYNYELYNTIIMLLNCSLQQCLKIALGAWLHCTPKTKFKMSLFLKWRHLKWKTARCRKINDLEKCKEELQRSIIWSDCSKKKECRRRYMTQKEIWKRTKGIFTQQREGQRGSWLLKSQKVWCQWCI